MSDLYITKIENTLDGIAIYINGGSSYFIDRQSFKDVIEPDISDWIHQLMEKTWCDTNSLYRIGAILCNTEVHVPEWKKGKVINWEDTFFMVEKRNYIEGEFEKRKIAQESLVDTSELIEVENFDSLIYRIKLEQELTNDEVHEEVRKRVEKKLNQYGF